MASNRKMKGGEIILRALADQNVDHVFGYPGGVTLPLYDKIYLQNRLQHILVRHEQGAVHAAEGYARSTGKPGVVLVTSGPGATNTITGLTDALMDSIPVVCLTGQVVSNLIGNDAFQEADTTGISRQCTKHNYLVRHTDDLARVLHEAFHVATHGRPGPVLVDIPKDVILGEGVYLTPEEVPHPTYNPAVKGNPDRIAEAVELLANAKRPIIYAGGGVINAGPKAAAALKELVKLTGYPCTTTLMGLGAYPASDPQFVGMPGMHGTYEANMAMYHCDVMFNVGARFDDRVTGRLDSFSPGSKKVHIDIDPSSINKNITVDVPIIGDAARVLTDIVKAWKARNPRRDRKAEKSWWGQIEKWRRRDCLSYDHDDKIIKPQFALERLELAVKKHGDYYITTDVGQHQMWAAQYLGFDKPNRWMTSGGLGTMGYGMPAALGVQVAHPESLVVCVTSEGSLMMNIQELSTIHQERLPVKILNLNNSVLGMIRQWQEFFHDEHYSECDLSSAPDFVKLAEAFGLTGLYTDKPSEVDDVLAEMIKIDGPVLVNMVVSKNENVYPMIAAGAAHNEIMLGPNSRAAAGGDESMVMA